MKRLLLSLPICLVLFANCDTPTTSSVKYTSSQDSSRGLALYTDTTYDGYGSLVAEITPETFKMPVIHMRFIDTERGSDGLDLVSALYESNQDEKCYANFTQNMEIDIDMPEKVNGYFNMLDIYMPGQPGSFIQEASDVNWSYEPEIVFTLPESYSTTIFPDYPNKENCTITTNTAIPLQENVFTDPTQPTPFYIFSGSAPTYLHNPNGAIVDHYAYFGTFKIVAPSYSSIIHGPLEAIDVPDGFRHLGVTVNFDIHNMIQVYDAGTPSDLTDDIITLAPNYWDRITVDLDIIM